MEFDTFLTMVREVFHFGIAITLLSYQPHGARHRFCISALATLLAAANLGLGVMLLTKAVEPHALGRPWLHVGAFGFLFWLILMCRGNVAKIFPNRSQGAR